MARVAVSARRMRSLLANRHQDAAELSSQLDLSFDLVSAVAADTELTYADLAALASHFNKPWSYLLIDEPEVFDTPGQDNRSFGNRQLPLSPEILDEVEAVGAMLQAAAELFPDGGYQVPPVVIETDTLPDAAGVVIREFLDVSHDQQLRARDEFSALRLWVDALHSRGVYVSQRRLRDPAIRAFSRVQDEQAVLVVDTGDSAYARAFSLIHEYCHVVLRSTGLCDLDDHSSVERYCNATAAAVLMPRELVFNTLADRTFADDATEADGLLRELSQEVHVSQAALLIRLRDLRVIDVGTYDALEERRKSRRSDEGKVPGGSFYPPRINRVGRRFARNVFASLDDGGIDRQDASALLEIGEHLVSTYRSELEGHGRRAR